MIIRRNSDIGFAWSAGIFWNRKCVRASCAKLRLIEISELRYYEVELSFFFRVISISLLRVLKYFVRQEGNKETISSLNEIDINGSLRHGKI